MHTALLIFPVILLSIGIGVVCGYVIFTISDERSDVSGTLKIDTSDPEDVPYLFLEVSEPVEQIMQRKHIVLKVDKSSYISQK